MKKIVFLLLIFTIQNINASNYSEKKWGYILRIVDKNYIPEITHTDEYGYITLETGIASFDAIFSKYKIKEFNKSEPIPSPEQWMWQIYVLICDKEQIQLGVDLRNNFGNIIPFIQYGEMSSEVKIPYGYLLKIVDKSYVPEITHTNEQGYITLETGIAPYDAIFSKYKIKEFNHYYEQSYHLICEEEQGQLSVELSKNFNNVIPLIELFVLYPQLTFNKDIASKDFFEEHGGILYFDDTVASIEISFFDLRGNLLFKEKLIGNSFDPSYNLSNKGLYIYQINIDGKPYCGKYFNLIKK